MPGVVTWIVWTSVAIVIFGSGLAGWSQIAVRRTRILTDQEPGSVVRMSTATPQVFASLEALALIRGKEIPPPTFGITLVTNERGIEFWSGWRTPWLYQRLTWDHVERVEPTTPGESAIPGVAIVVRSPDGFTRVPIALTGGWPGGSRALNSTQRAVTIERVASQLVEFTRRAV